MTDMSNTNKMDELYEQVTAMVDQSLAAVLGNASAINGNLDLEGAFTSSTTLLEKFRDKTNEDIRELRTHAEWDTFTIAFYGETNAGKSTLIETLRILLGDSEKLAEQQQFKALAEDLRVDPHSLAALEKSILQLERQLTESQGRADTLQQKQHSEEQQHSTQLETLKASVEHRRKNMSLWQKLVFLFKKLDEEKALHAHHRDRCDSPLRSTNQGDQHTGWQNIVLVQATLVIPMA